MDALSPDQYERVIPLVRASGMRGHLAFVFEVIHGIKKGCIYADQPHHPRTALVCNETGFFFAFGEPDYETAYPMLLRLWENKHSLYPACLFASTTAWGGLLNQILLPLGAKPTARLGFELRERLPVPPVPSGYSLHPITSELARSILDGSGTDGYGIDPWFIRICGGAVEYATHQLGFALLYGNLIASICGFCALANGEAELEIGTVPSQRGKGLAIVTSLAFMEQCYQTGYEPVYTCTSTNLTSRAAAKKLGYFEVEEITGFNLPIDP